MKVQQESKLYRHMVIRRSASRSSKHTRADVSSKPTLIATGGGVRGLHGAGSEVLYWQRDGADSLLVEAVEVGVVERILGGDALAGRVCEHL